VTEPRAIIDTGVIVALIDKREARHAWAQEQAARVPTPYLTCEAVVSEACFLLRHVAGGEQQVLSLVERGVVQLAFDLSAEVALVGGLMKKYENVPMSLADACLVRMSELRASASVFTLDSDFHVYRRNGREAIPLIIPDAA
jgi:predicted nucleic acid-binding protein